MLARLTEKQLGAELLDALAGALAVPKRELKPASRAEAEVVIDAADHRFVVAVLATPSPGALAARVEQLAVAVRRQRRKVVPVLAVPFMSDAGRRVCQDADVSWLDLCGNAHIIAPGLRILVDGRPNRFRGPGRPASIFAPKSARVVRWLLENPGQALTQREIARATDMSEGFVSRIAARLEAESYVVRERTGALRAKDPQLLLDAWRDEYRFDKHQLLQGHVAARSGDALARIVAAGLTASSVDHAATGLAAAWQMTRFAAFRIATFFIAERPTRALLDRLGFRDDPRGANLWLVIPNDAGVFHGAARRDGIRCVHPVQAYLDLHAHPERAPEAADRLRSELLRWGHDG